MLSDSRTSVNGNFAKSVLKQKLKPELADSDFFSLLLLKNYDFRLMKSFNSGLSSAPLKKEPCFHPPSSLTAILESNKEQVLKII